MGVGSRRRKPWAMQKKGWHKRRWVGGSYGRVSVFGERSALGGKRKRERGRGRKKKGGIRVLEKHA